MCYHTALIVAPEELGRRFRRRTDRIREFRPAYRVSAFAHEQYPVVTADEEMRLYRWGLIPFWTGGLRDAAAIRNRTVNARAETIFTKPSFRSAVRRRRCLVPASGFFDWQHTGKEKIPYYVTLKDRPVMAIAGIYDCWHDPETGMEVETYSIVTTEANELLSRIHNANRRMPVILPSDDEERWLDPSLTDARIGALLRPYPSRPMEAVAVRNDFLRKRSDDPSILTPRG